MQVLTKNKKAVAIAAGVTAAAAGLYILFKKALEGGSSIDHINVEYDDNKHLTPDTILEVMNAALKQITPEYQRIYWKEREVRRTLVEDLDKYTDLCMGFIEDFNALIVNGRKEVLAAVGISDQEWTDSNTFYLENNNPEILAFYSNLQPNLKATIESKHTLSEQEFVTILSRHVALLEIDIDKIEEKINNRQKAVEIVQKRIGDKIFEEYGIEDEDFIVALKKYHDVPQVRAIMKMFLTLIKKLRTGGNQ